MPKQVTSPLRRARTRWMRFSMRRNEIWRFDNVDRESSLLRPGESRIAADSRRQLWNLHRVRLGDQPRTPRGVPWASRCIQCQEAADREGRRERLSPRFSSMPRNPRTIAFLGNYLPRKCGIATFTSDLLGAVAARHPQSQCFAMAGQRHRGMLSVSGRCSASRLRSRIWVLSARRRVPEHQQRGHRLGPARVRNIRRAGRQPLVGPAARIEGAGRHHAPHRSPQAERRPASRDAGIDRALNPAGGHDGAGTNDLCRRCTRRLRPRSISSRMVFPT